MQRTTTNSDTGAAVAAALIAGPFIFAAIAVALVAQVALRGFVLSTLWGWFIESTFSAPHLSIGGAVGVSIVVTAMTATITRDKTNFMGYFIGPLVSLAVGAVAHYFFGVG